MTPSRFAHGSEAELARLLDFYRVAWEYEPRSFPIAWSAGGHPVEYFTPDFYLPEYDLYIELTVAKPIRNTRKNRKVRLLQSNHPHVKVKLFTRRDIERLFAQREVRELIEDVLFDAPTIARRVDEIASDISRDYAGTTPALIGLLSGAMPFLADLSRAMSIPCQIDAISVKRFGDGDSIAFEKNLGLSIEGRHAIVVDDTIDTGLTMRYLMQALLARQPASLAACVLLDRPRRRIADIEVKYRGFEVPDVYAVGYGLDYLGRYRELPALYAHGTWPA